MWRPLGNCPVCLPPPLKSGLAGYLSKLGHISSSLLFSSQVRRTLIDFDNFRQTCCLESKQSKCGLLFRDTSLLHRHFIPKPQTNIASFRCVIGFAQLVEMYIKELKSVRYWPFASVGCPGIQILGAGGTTVFVSICSVPVSAIQRG